MRILTLLLSLLAISSIFNACQEPAVISYTEDIKPLLSTCANDYCHGQNTLGISFNNYDNTVASINTGRVIGALKQEVGFSAMPKGNEEDGKWSEEDIQLLEDWISDGMPE